MAIGKVWVVAEISGGAPTATTLELLAGAKGLSPAAIEVVAFGGQGASVAGALGAAGATKIYEVGDLGDALPGPSVAGAIAAQIAEGNSPDVVLAGATYDGRDIAARLSARIGKPVITNVVALSAGADGSPVAEHAIFGGTQVAKSEFTGSAPWIFVVRAKSFVVEEAPSGAPAEVVNVSVPDLGAVAAAKVVNRHVEERSGPKLDEAAVVVSGGRGLGQPENYGLIEELAKLLNGAPGASRAIVDAGWVPYAYQVGQTGKTVKPTVYIACGISGATQHMVGMKGAKNIIAINKDKDAPIFSISDLGVVGDVHKVIPALIDTLKNR